MNAGLFCILAINLKLFGSDMKYVLLLFVLCLAVPACAESSAKTVVLNQLESQIPNNGYATPLQFGAFPDKFIFADDRLYIGLWACSVSPDTGVSLSVYDRNTLMPLNNKNILGCDDKEQGEIQSILVNKDKIYLSIAYRYENKKAPNFFILNKKTLNIEKRVFVAGGLGTLHAYEGHLVECRDHGDRKFDCAYFNVNSLEKTPAPNLKRMSGFSQYEKIVAQSPIYASLMTPNFYLSYSHPGDNLIVLSKADLQKKDIKFDKGDYPREFLSVRGRDAVITKLRDSRTREKISYVNVSDASKHELMSITNDGKSAIETDGDRIFIGNQHDLYIFDINSFKLLQKIENFIPEKEERYMKGPDRNSIIRLIVDKNHLIALTRNGEKSRTLDLSN